MNAFWRQEPLSDADCALISAVQEAHGKSSFRQNPSTVVVQCVAQGSGSLCKALAAAMITIGGTHGPIEESYEILASDDSAAEIVREHLALGKRLPGWGSSFSKGKPDEMWAFVEDKLWTDYQLVARRIEAFTYALLEEGRKIYPNPSAYTAAAAIALKMPKRLSPYLFVIGRVAAWTEIFLNETKGT